MYAELVYFHGAHYAHIAAFHEDTRLKRLRPPRLRPLCRPSSRPINLTYLLPCE
jgi:hypothetical protein